MQHSRASLGASFPSQVSAWRRRPCRAGWHEATHALRLLALAAGLVHNTDIGNPGRHFAAYGY
jgi:hypothetical protein